MPRSKSKPDIEQKICKAALRLAARQGWNGLTIEQIAKAAKIPPPELRKHFAGKEQIVAAIIHWIGEQVTAAIGKIDPKATPHDRLFEILMARFDILQTHRDGVLAIMSSMSRDPALGRLIFPAHWHAMQEILALARLESRDMRRYAIIGGLLGVYYWTLCCWKRDQTGDMSKTMAVLDRSLRRATVIGEILFRKF